MGPPIAAVPPNVRRPTWSVMIPTYHCARFLVQTLNSVLSQDPGPERMQIEVVDDCSTQDDPEAVVRELGRGRVGFYRQPQNVGATRNFNTCIERSLGHLVQTLHGDDWVLPGFYDKIELTASRHPEVAFFTTRIFWVDDEGNIDSLNPRTPVLERPTKNVQPFLYGNPFCPSGVVIRRQFYEDSGGYLPNLIHTADWEMWVRAIGLGGGFAINQPLACYRRLASAETGRLARTAENLWDFLRLEDIFSFRYNDEFDKSTFRKMLTSAAIAQANRFHQLGDSAAFVANEEFVRQLRDNSTRLELELITLK